MEQDHGVAHNELPSSGHLLLRNVICGDNKQRCVFNIDIAAGCRVLASAKDMFVQRSFDGLLKRHLEPLTGSISLDHLDLTHCDLFDLRQCVIVIDRPTLMPITIRDYLNLAAPEANASAHQDVLELVDLVQSIGGLEHGLNTRVSEDGWPLSISQAIRLKLAAAALAQPRIIILGEIFDIVEPDCLSQAIDVLSRSGANTVIYFTRRLDMNGFTHRLYLNHDQQKLQAIENNA